MTPNAINSNASANLGYFNPYYLNDSCPTIKKWPLLKELADTMKLWQKKGTTITFPSWGFWRCVFSSWKVESFILLGCHLNCFKTTALFCFKALNMFTRIFLQKGWVTTSFYIPCLCIKHSFNRSSSSLVLAGLSGTCSRTCTVRRWCRRDGTTGVESDGKTWHSENKAGFWVRSVLWVLSI